MRDRLDLLTGVLLGTAVGDSLGLPREGLSPRRAEALYGSDLRQCFLFGHGMISDDTEHTCLTGQALLRGGGDADRFVRHLAGGLRGWLATFPAGIGLATLRACLRLWLGFPPSRSGVWSAGNGPAMRAALLGVCLGDRPEVLRAFVRAGTRLTHTDPRRRTRRPAGGAGRPPRRRSRSRRHRRRPFSVPCATGANRPRRRAGRPAPPPGEQPRPRRHHRGVCRRAGAEPRRQRLHLPHRPGGAARLVVAPGGLPPRRRGGRPGGRRRRHHRGDRRRDRRRHLRTAAIPPEWLRLAEWPRSVGWMRRLAERLGQAYPVVGPGHPPDPPRLCWPALWPRNLFFFTVVLAHLGRRLLPPYR